MSQKAENMLPGQ